MNPVCGGVRHASLLPIYSHGTASAALFRGKVLLAFSAMVDTVDKIMLTEWSI